MRFGPQSQFESLQFPFLHRAADRDLLFYTETRFDNGLADVIPYVRPHKSGASLRACSSQAAGLKVGRPPSRPAYDDLMTRCGV